MNEGDELESLRRKTAKKRVEAKALVRRRGFGAGWLTEKHARYCRAGEGSATSLGVKGSNLGLSRKRVELGIFVGALFS